MKIRSSLQVLCIYSLIAFTHIFASQIDIVKIKSSDLAEQRVIFKSCWYSIYQNCSLKQLGFDDLSKYLHESFDKEELDFIRKTPNRLFFNAVENEQIIGYISFDIKNEHAVYIKQIALLPDFCTADFLRELIFVIFDHIEDVSCIHMILHAQAVNYKEMATELGFVALAQVNNKNVHLRLQFNKCGTCLCDFDYEQDQDDQDDQDKDFLFDNDSCSQNSDFCEIFEKE